MNKIKSNLNVIMLAVCFSAELFCQNNSSYNILDINQLKIYLPNNGIIENSQNLFGDAVFWPGGTNAYQQFFWNIKLMWAGYTEDELRVNGLSGVLQPGKIEDNGVADDPGKEKYRVFRILKNWETTPFGPERDQLEKDYNEWPVEDGAPWIDRDGDGIFTRGVDQPNFLGMKFFSMSQMMLIILIAIIGTGLWTLNTRLLPGI